MTDLPYSKKITEIAAKWLDGTITGAEKTAFIDWYNRFDDRQLLLDPVYAPIIKELEEKMLTDIRQRIKADASPSSGEENLTDLPPPSHEENRRVFPMKWFRLSAAAILIGLTATGAWFFVAARRSTPAPTAAQKTTPHPVQTDMPPGSYKAVLTLGDGSTLALDSARNGSLARQGNTQVLKMDDGQLRYKAIAGNSPAAPSYNVLSTPKGGQYRLVLPDGSKIWLNAASSIRYPTAFTGTERKVEITGEAYFEIARNASMPFQVLADSRLGAADPMTIQVLGTHFNVNAYGDEPAIRTTLEEGAVKVTKGSASRVLQPGQQTQLQKDGEMRWTQTADVDKEIAWKNGVFEFRDEGLQGIMRQIARWYDVDVVYEGKIPTEEFTGRVSRNTSLAGVLKILQLSDIRLSIENNKIVVRS